MTVIKEVEEGNIFRIRLDDFPPESLVLCDGGVGTPSLH